MAAIYISYRPEDSAGHAGRLSDRLADAFGRDNVIMDAIQQGADIASAVEELVARTEVMLVVIGRRWDNAWNRSGVRALDDPADPVRLEIAAALKRDMRVIPVLVNDASFPPFDSFPPDIEDLTRRQAFEVADQRWDRDIARLTELLGDIVPGLSAGSQEVEPARSQSEGSGDARDVFISYVEKDGPIAAALARELRGQGQSTWTYEEDGVPGLSYLSQVDAAIESCRAVVLLASAGAVRAHQVIREIEAAHELAKMIIPVRIGLTHDEFMKSNRILRMATGTAVSLAMRDGDTANVAKRIALALRTGAARD